MEINPRRVCPLPIAAWVAAAVFLSACGGGGELSIDRPQEGGAPQDGAETLQLEFRPGQTEQHRLPLRISGGVPPYTSSIEGCPDWVALFPDQGILAGAAPASAYGRTFLCAYVVTDSGTPDAPPASITPRQQTKSFGLRLVVESPAILDLPEVSDQEFVIGAFHSDVLPPASGGVQPYAYSLTCAGGTLPSGMAFAPSSRVFAGTPDAPFRDSCTYTVRDSSQPAATFSQVLEVTSAAAQPLGLPGVSGQELVIGAFHSDVLPPASGGVEPYAYSFACTGGTLPPGMAFAPATRVFAGAPDAPFRDSCTYTVRDSSQPAAMFSQVLEVTSAAAQPLGLPEVSDQDIVIGAFHSDTLPEASGGVEPYVYSFTCAGGTLPPGMAFAPGTRVFAGAPDAPFRDSCAYTVRDSSQPAATFSQVVEVTSAAAQPLGLPEVSDQDLVIGSYRSVTLPEATGGVEPYTYSLTCAGGTLPSGTAFAPETRRFAGTPGARFRDSCTYSVTDASQPAATVSVPVEVEAAGPVTGTLALPRPSKAILSVGTFHDGALPAATGGVPPYTYSFTCAGGALPSGMSFARETRVFAGTPGARFRDSCTYTVTDSSQPAATISVAVEVEVTVGETALKIEQLSEEISGGELTLNIGKRSQITFEMAEGGVPPYTYELDCDLPPGLGFHPGTRVLSGTPDAEYRGPDCTYRVTDSSSPPASASLSLALVVEPLDLETWRFRTRTEDPTGPCTLAYPPGNPEPLTIAILPHAQGGEPGQDNYDLVDFPSSDHFLDFDEGTRKLTYTNPGAPPILGTPNTYRYLVRDDGKVHDALCHGRPVQYRRRFLSRSRWPSLTRALYPHPASSAR